MANAGTDAEELERFATEVERLSHGSIRIDFKNNWGAGERAFENGLVADVRAGKADLGSAGSRAWDSVGVNDFRALHAPFLIDSYPLQEAVIRSPLVKRMLQSLGPLGLVGLGVLPGQMQRPFGVRHSLLKPADFAGLTIAVQQSRVADETLRALGARSVWIPSGRNNLERFDGSEQSVGAFDSFLYDALGSFLGANVDLWPRPLVLFANHDVFSALTLEQQRALRGAAHEVIPEQIASSRESDRLASESLCRRRLLTFETAGPDDLAALRRAVQPVYDDLERDKSTQMAIAAIELLKRDLRAPPASLPPCQSADRRALGPPEGTWSPPGPIDGVYRMTTRFGDLRDDRTPIAEHYGTYTYVFSSGRFAYTQEYRKACTWGFGWFRVTGNQVEWTFIDGGGKSPNHALDKSGEVFSFGWSRYRDALTLTPVEDGISPEWFRAKPWRRLSDAPDKGFVYPAPWRDYLSKDCAPPGWSLPTFFIYAAS